MKTKILIIIPNWLGDAIMVTPTINLLIHKYKNCEITLVGSSVSIELLKEFKNVTRTFVDNSKKSKSRVKYIVNLAREIGSHDLAITFRNNLLSLLLLKVSRSKKILKSKNFYIKSLLHPKQKSTKTNHQVEIYSNIINEYKPEDTTLTYKAKKLKNITVGINAGATYGSAKKWSYFSDLIIEINRYKKGVEFILFGGVNEEELINDITEILDKHSDINYINLSGKTSLAELCSYIGGLDLFITNDSGPMHIASAYKTKSISIFGPTNYIQTSQWKNPNDTIVRLNLECMPCLERSCPLTHHNCMKDLLASDVMDKIKEVF